MYKNKAYIIKNITNLHAGSGDTNFGIVDKEVQRDTVSPLPVVNASSLKGALRYHFESQMAANNQTEDPKEVKPSTIDVVFGSEEKQTQGFVKFIEARLLFLPLRSNKRPFYHVTSRAALEQFVQMMEAMGVRVDIEIPPYNEKSYVVHGESGTVIEDVLCETKEFSIPRLQALFGIENLAVFNDEDFNEALSALPVIARNKLDNGKSENLWYEEVVPRESLFYTCMCYYDNFNQEGADRRGKSDRSYYLKAFERFEKRLLDDNIQIGANESIGYGICRFRRIGGES
jgi:CRISPR-associated protein Cmr4